MPRGKGFVESSTFEAGYETLKRATGSFQFVTPETVTSAVHDAPVVLLVLRCMLGFTPPEWAAYATSHTSVEITQGAARTIDRAIRMNPDSSLSGRGEVTNRRVDALISSACDLLHSGLPDVPHDSLHRLDKVDTREGLVSLRSMADLGAPYSILLYERFLGRPFAAHRDSVSELGGEPRGECHRRRAGPCRDQLSQDRTSGAAAGIRSGSGLRRTERVQSTDRH